MTGNVIVNITNGSTATATLPAATVRPREIDLSALNDIPVDRSKGHSKTSDDWYRIENVDEDAADVYIFDAITSPILSEVLGVGISALSFIRAVSGLQGKRLNVHINSPGGDFFQAMGIYNALRQHKAPVHVFIDGLAASAASLVAMAGDTVTMAAHARLMIHDVRSDMEGGTSADYAKRSQVLDKLSTDLAAVYRDRGDKRINWRAKMIDETWISDQEAVSLGLADSIDSSRVAVTNRFDLSRFQNVPEELVSEDTHQDRTLTKRDLEDMLRDAGLSNREAKAFVSTGWKALGTRDESEEPDEGEERETPEGEETALSTGTVEEADDMALLRNRLRLHELAIA